MSLSARDAYLETQVLTATPQRLRLMLIETALLKAKVAHQACEANDKETALAAIGLCRDIVSELIAGIQPDQTPLTKQVLGIYMFVYSALVEIGLTVDGQRLRDVVRVLEEELQTWRSVCEQMPERPVSDKPSTVAEELAPQRVAEAWTGGYAGTPHSRKANSGELSLEA
jgi:flagellar protein FliS